MPYNVKLPYLRYPGEGYYYIMCDICGAKIRAKDARLITDKYNTKANLLVCKDDYDITNPQTYIKAFRERQIDNPKYIRSEGADNFVFISDVAEIEGGDSGNPTARTASAPKYLNIIAGEALAVEMQWIGPDDVGGRPITGYQIDRESPIGGGFATLATTTAVATYYKDTTAVASTQYNYRVSAVTSEGVGLSSNESSVTTTA